jgi:hypothetical protein
VGDRKKIGKIFDRNPLKKFEIVYASFRIPGSLEGICNNFHRASPSGTFIIIAADYKE